MTIALVLAACGGSEAPPAEDTSLSPLAALGRAAFHDPTLSASGTQSCARCHVPTAGHGGPIQALRAAQPLRYLGSNTRFHYDLEDFPLGGYTWDGRAESPAMQASRALLGPHEMANASKTDVAARIARSAWSDRFQELFGTSVFSDPDLAFAQLADALEAYQREDAQFNAFTSKYDAVLRGEAQLTVQEARGLALFTDPAKGNCASCHRATPAYRAPQPVFTDFGYANLGVPRNPRIAANSDPAFFDLGLCAREDLKERQELCGHFRTPSLRNVVLRQAFFHNGRFTSLKEAIEFKVTRDVTPQRWYPNGVYDDVPAHLRGTVTRKPPFDRGPGMQPALTDSEIDDVIAFLATLTDR